MNAAEDRFHTEELDLTTGGEPGLFDLTSRLRSFCRDRGNGLLTVFVPHATAGVAILETGAGSEADLMDIVDSLLPVDHDWGHSHGSPGHGRDHVLPAFISPSVTIPVVEGEPTFGTWQSVVMVDTNRDNPHRRVRFTFLG